MKFSAVTLTIVLLFGFSSVPRAQEASAIQTGLSKDVEMQKSEASLDDCIRIVRVESPCADTYTSFRADTLNFGGEISLKLRGAPDKKAMLSHLNFSVPDIQSQQVDHCILKVYTVSKHIDSKLFLYGLDKSIDEEKTNWQDQPKAEFLLVSKPVGAQPFVEFEVTSFVKDRLDNKRINFCIRTDSKKPIEISSRESGLGSELIIDHCGSGKAHLIVDPISAKQGKYGMNVLPNLQDGKFTIELLGVPAGGFGDLMIMDDGGSIIRRLPMAIRDGEILQHTMDYGSLIPGKYWAVFRKGRVLIKDQFRLQPSPELDKLLEVAIDTVEEEGKSD